MLARFDALFNDSLTTACAEFGIGDLSYAIDFSQSLGVQNFFEGNRSFEGLLFHHEPTFPAVAFWIGPGQDRQLAKPRKFSGEITAYWRFWFAVEGRLKPGLVDLREATESAMIQTLDPEMPGFGYHGLGWNDINEQVWLDQEQKAIGYVQEIVYSASFEVNV
ncbi:MAG TPA: hypothetical protein VE820_13765 [Sphingomicrobium sp.]|nr:hypothetical protein [Sphingomicrobium sp.]